MFMRAMATPLFVKPPNTMLPTPRKVGIMITHVVGARHPNIVAGGGGGSRGKAGSQMKLTTPRTAGSVAAHDDDADAHAAAHR